MLTHSPRLMFHTADPAAPPSGGAPAPAPTPTPGDVAAQQIAAQQAAATPPVATPPVVTPPAADVKTDLATLPADVRKLITDANAEAAKYRVEKNAAEAQRTAVLASYGLGPDLKPLPTDPATAAASTELADTKRELAVVKAAAGKADAAKLLDSRAFLDSIKTIDSSDSTAIDAAIAAALVTNPQFKSTPAAGASGLGDLTGGGETGKITEAEMVRLSKEDPEALDKLAREGKLDHFLK